MRALPEWMMGGSGNFRQPKGYLSKTWYSGWTETCTADVQQARSTETSLRKSSVKETGRYDFCRGVKDPCVCLCLKTGLTVVHHIDDGRCAGKTALLDKLLDEDLPQLRDHLPSKKANLENLEPLSAGKAAQCRSDVGSAIYLSADRRDIQFAVKDPRHMSAPRACDWECAQNHG